MSDIADTKSNVNAHLEWPPSCGKEGRDMGPGPTFQRGFQSKYDTLSSINGVWDPMADEGVFGIWRGSQYMVWSSSYYTSIVITTQQTENTDKKKLNSNGFTALQTQALCDLENCLSP
jgi:hypothetical protein